MMCPLPAAVVSAPIVRRTGHDVATTSYMVRCRPCGFKDEQFDPTLAKFAAARHNRGAL